MLRPSPTPPRPDHDLLDWVVVGGQLRAVSEFATLRPAERPAVSCAGCGEALTLKLGPVVRHHAAHRPGATCAYSGGEGVLHLRTKIHLAEALRQMLAVGVGAPVTRARLPIRVACTQAQTPVPLAWHPTRDAAQSRTRAAIGLCDQALLAPWTQGDWDRVEVETAVPHATRRYRPDVSLYAGERLVGAIEVLVSHAVDAEKAAALDGAGIAWVEVCAEALPGSVEEMVSRLDTEGLPVSSHGTHLGTSSRGLCCAPCRRLEAAMAGPGGEGRASVAAVALSDFYRVPRRRWTQQHGRWIRHRAERQRRVWAMVTVSWPVEGPTESLGPGAPEPGPSGRALEAGPLAGGGGADGATAQPQGAPGGPRGAPEALVLLWTGGRWAGVRWIATADEQAAARAWVRTVPRALDGGDSETHRLLVLDTTGWKSGRTELGYRALLRRATAGGARPPNTLALDGEYPPRYAYHDTAGVWEPHRPMPDWTHWPLGPQAVASTPGAPAGAASQTPPLPDTPLTRAIQQMPGSSWAWRGTPALPGVEAVWEIMPARSGGWQPNTLLVVPAPGPPAPVEAVRAVEHGLLTRYPGRYLVWVARERVLTATCLLVRGGTAEEPQLWIEGAEGRRVEWASAWHGGTLTLAPLRRADGSPDPHRAPRERARRLQ